jgi:hypothetical protein
MAERAADRLRKGGFAAMRGGVAGWSVSNGKKTWRLTSDQALCDFERGVSAGRES